MISRPLTIEDEPEIRRLFEQQGFEYELPTEGFFAGCGIFEDGKLVQAVAARKTCELYLFADQAWGTPAWRLAALKRLHEDMGRELKRLGYTDAHIWLPPEIAKSFGRRLMRTFGWSKQLWESFSHKVRE